jgi:hypothetical protein
MPPPRARAESGDATLGIRACRYVRWVCKCRETGAGTTGRILPAPELFFSISTSSRPAPRAPADCADATGLRSSDVDGTPPPRSGFVPCTSPHFHARCARLETGSAPLARWWSTATAELSRGIEDRASPMIARPTRPSTRTPREPPPLKCLTARLILRRAAISRFLPQTARFGVTKTLSAAIGAGGGAAGPCGRPTSRLGDP